MSTALVVSFGPVSLETSPANSPTMPHMIRRRNAGERLHSFLHSSPFWDVWDGQRVGCRFCSLEGRTSFPEFDCPDRVDEILFMYNNRPVANDKRRKWVVSIVVSAFDLECHVTSGLTNKGPTKAGSGWANTWKSHPPWRPRDSNHRVI